MKSNQGHYEPSLTPLAPMKRPFESVFRERDRYKAALEDIVACWEDDPDGTEAPLFYDWAKRALNA